MSRHSYCAFAPDNGYIINSPTNWSRCNLPEGLEDAIAGPFPFVYTYNVAIGPNGSYYIGGDRTAKKDSRLYAAFAHSNNLPSALMDWLGDPADRVNPRDYPTTQVILGPKDSYFAQDKSSVSSYNLPKALVDFFDLFPPAQHEVTMLALGPGDSYIVLNKSGSFAYDLTACSPALDAQFDEYYKVNENFVANLVYFSMDTTVPGRYIYFTKDGDVEGMVPSEWAISGVVAKIQDALKKEAAEAAQKISAAQATPTSKLVAPRPAARKPSSTAAVNGALRLGMGLLKIAAAGNGGGGGGGNGGATYTTYDAQSYSSSSGGSDFWQPIDSAANAPIQ